MEKIIHIQHLNFKNKEEATLLSDCSVSFGTSKVYAVLGESSESKTALLNVISGLVFAKSGKIEVNGYVPAKRKTHMLQNLFYVPEIIKVPAVSLETFELTYSFYYPNFNESAFYSYLNDFMIDSQTKNIDEMSALQKRKLMIAFGLATNAKIVLLDQPTVDFDDSSLLILKTLLQKPVQKKKCILINGSNLHQLCGLVTDLVILAHGKVQLSGSIEDLSKTFTGEYMTTRHLDAPEFDIHGFYQSFIIQPEKIVEAFNH